MATAHRAPNAVQSSACPICGPELPGGCNHSETDLDRPVKPGTVPSHRRWTDQNASVTDPTPILLVGLEGLDRLGVGLAVCNVFGQLLLANETAEKFLAARDGLQLNADRVLCATRSCSPPLEELVQRAASVVLDRSNGCKDAALSVPRSSGQRALTVLVRSITCASIAVNAGQPAALVLILDSAVSAETIVVELQQLFGLTSTEAHLANLLMEGDALDDCCDRLGIRRSTGCTHLKRIFKKTGVRRQSELVALLLKSIGLARLKTAETASAGLRGTRLRNPFMHKEPRSAGRASQPA